MHNVKIISLKEPFTDEFNGVLCVSCMSYIIALIFGQSQHRKTQKALYRWNEGVALNSICIVKRGKTLSLCGVNSFIFLFSFWLREVRIDLVRTSTILHVRLVPKIQPAPCYIPKIQIVLPKLAPSQPAPCYPEITTRAKTPSSCQIPTREIPLLTLSQKGR